MNRGAQTFRCFKTGYKYRFVSTTSQCVLITMQLFKIMVQTDTEGVSQPQAHGSAHCNSSIQDRVLTNELCCLKIIR